MCLNGEIIARRNIVHLFSKQSLFGVTNVKPVAHRETKQESPAIADKPARRESLPKIAPIRRAYNVVADNTGLSSCV